MGRAHMSPSLAPPPATTLRWKSPVPYLFLGLALMLGLIVAIALLVLACSLRRSSTSSSSDEGEKSRKRDVLPQGEMEPKIVVVMPGDDWPTYLASPVCSSPVTR
ncbi:hypothetical protein Sjap_024192 [Stephania japonica]|uniref:Uncharacterized protein n=1 Tax=Stephania japonica TaxID=461633 RepID=A0AAP0ECZ2_9MAGN